MGNFFVAGVTQIETIVKVKEVPIVYQPLTEAVGSIYAEVGGDAYNETLALLSLGNKVTFVSHVGRDQEVGVFNPHHADIMIPTKHIIKDLSETPTSVMLFDEHRNQQIFEDIKDLRSAKSNLAETAPLMEAADMVVLANANFCRPFAEAAKKMGKKVAVNIRCYNKRKEKYNEDFFNAADILYLSDDTIKEDPRDFVRKISAKYDIDIVIMGQGKEGCVLYDRTSSMDAHFNSVSTGQVVNTAGAGNALFSCFLHYYLETGDSTLAIKNALLFASYKIGFMGTSEGFLSPAQVKEWFDKIWGVSDPFSKYSGQTGSGAED